MGLGLVLLGSLILIVGAVYPFWPEIKAKVSVFLKDKGIGK